MQITLKCVYESGSASFPAERIEGLPVAARQYAIVSGLLTVAGAEVVVHHDVEQLLQQGIYRMLIPQEQEALAKEADAAGMVQEIAEQGEISPPDPPPAVEQPATSKKKASGG